MDLMASRLRLRELLEERGLTQSDLVRRSGLSAAAVNKMCNRPPKSVYFATLDKIAAALGVSVHDVISEDPPRKKAVQRAS